MKLNLAVLLIFAASGCANIERNTRTERGPLLRTFERPQIVEGGVHGTAAVEWPKLKVDVRGFDTCRQLMVEEYSEDTITEKTSSATGPALSTGFANILASGVLFTVSQFVSNTPQIGSIDAAGHYGPSTRQQLQVTGWITLGVGVPALVVGLISYLRSGEEVETRKVESIASQKDKNCNERPIDGPVELRFGSATPLHSQVATAGSVAFDATAVGESIEGISFYGRAISFDESSQRAIDAFSACALLEKAGPVVPAKLEDPDLVEFVNQMTVCVAVRPDMEPVRDRALDELNKRRDVKAPQTLSDSLRVKSFEEALTLYAPKIYLKAKSADLAQLNAPEKLKDQAVRLEGIVSSSITANIGVLQVGERRVFVFIPGDNIWGQSFSQGQRVELIGVVAGKHTMGSETLPLLRAVWMRAAF